MISTPSWPACPARSRSYVGRLDAPAYARLPDATHYAASTMKVAVLAALYRAAEAGTARPGPRRCRWSTSSTRPGPTRPGSPARRTTTTTTRSGSGSATAHPALARRTDDHPVQQLRHQPAHRPGRAARRGRSVAARRRPAQRHRPGHRGLRRPGRGHHQPGHPRRPGGAARRARRRCRAPRPPGLPGGLRRHAGRAAGPGHREDLAAGLPDGTRIAHKNGWVRGVGTAPGWSSRTTPRRT